VDPQFCGERGLPRSGRFTAQARSQRGGKELDNSFSNGQKWTLVLTQLVVCGDEAAITLDNHGVVNGQAFTMRGIEIWKVDDSGRVCQVRAYFEPPATVELDPYFQRQRDTAGEGAR
jgi:hypothetical protein